MKGAIRDFASWEHGSWDERRMGAYLRPDRIEDALEALARQPLAIVAGGTDFYPARVGLPLDDDVLDITALPGLRGIVDRGDTWHIGALTTWTDVIRADLPRTFDGLKLAAREVGGVQIQNAGTVCGNLCNASPAADGVPALLALDARVDLASAAGSRSLPLADFITGNRRTERAASELVVGLTLPKATGRDASTFLKLGARKYLVISIVMASAWVELAEDGSVAAARVAIGACSPVAERLPDLESRLAGVAPAEMSAAVAPDLLIAELSPIDDVRGTADYRLDAAVTVTRRVLTDVAHRLETAA